MTHFFEPTFRHSPPNFTNLKNIINQCKKTRKHAHFTSHLISYLEMFLFRALQTLIIHFDWETNENEITNLEEEEEEEERLILLNCVDNFN